jgi:uncharacterized protein (TIGR03067 family)
LNPGFFRGGIVKSVTSFCFAATLILGATACLADDKADSNAIYGYWSMTSGVSKGEAMSESTMRTVLLKFDDGEYFSKLDRQVDKGTYTVDGGKTPKQLTLVGTSGPNKGKKMLAIYELDKETLKVCYDLSGKAFPAKFESKSGTDSFLATYKRAKRRLGFKIRPPEHWGTDK